MITTNNNLFKKYLRECVRRFIKEEVDAYGLTPHRDTWRVDALPQNYDDTFQRIARQVAKKYNIPQQVIPRAFRKAPNGDVMYVGAPKKYAPKHGKEEGESNLDYFKRAMGQFNDKEEADPDEEWREIHPDLLSRYRGGAFKANDIGLVSNRGHLASIDPNDIGSLKRDKGRKKGMKHQFTIGKGKMSTTGVAHNIVAMTYNNPDGKYNLKDYKVVHKDGNGHNNHASNLQWVPRDGKAEKRIKAREMGQQNESRMRQSFTLNENEMRDYLKQLVNEAIMSMI